MSGDEDPPRPDDGTQTVDGRAEIHLDSRGDLELGVDRYETEVLVTMRLHPDDAGMPTQTWSTTLSPEAAREHAATVRELADAIDEYDWEAAAAEDGDAPDDDGLLARARTLLGGEQS